MIGEDLNRSLENVRPRVYNICQVLRAETRRTGLDPDEVSISDPDTAAFRLERDPASGANALIGEWRDAAGNKVGSLVFHADGSFFVEHDVIRTHPTRPQWFVEAVTAWGRGGDIRSEARLLAMAS